MNPDEHLPFGTSWEDLRFPVTGINPPGAASDPIRNTTDGTLEFSASQTNVIVGVAQMPHSWRVGSYIGPHWHWIAGSTNIGNVVWEFKYKIADILEDFPADYSSVTVTAPTLGSVTRHLITGASSIVMLDYKISAIILWILSRIGGNNADTFTGVAKLLEVDFHYQIDPSRVGSMRERSL